ncbi:YitT family protein [Roseateles toxinivorans]|uniref:Putative 5xTM membrane YitT family protein n=1 Tax=Roseateles toxinivorans TaxID=270368 RepID=A0A4R6QUD6_9BURK|nr:YitT family protein [Roseateles toxinivorans]TDP74803.1 putative 5xTM membrane YitT family protein [Roseateles toxinivorans]
MNVATPAMPPRHTLFDDAQALLTGTLFVAIGLLLLRQAGLVTGGTVGLAFLAHYATGLPFGALLFLVNLPFYWLAWRRMGRRFTLKTFAAVSLLALLSELLPRWISLQSVHPLFAAVAGGLLVGAGFIMLFRHRASLGGLNVLVLWLQERFGWRAGIVQMAIDALILLSAWPWIDAQRLALSVLAAAAMNFALAVNHRPGRYMAF